MAIIYSYPINTNILATDIILGTSTVIVNGKRKNQTKSFEVADLATYFASVILPPGSYVPYAGAIGPVNLGAFSLTANSVTTTIDSVINGLTIGRGGGNSAANTVVGNNALFTNITGNYNTTNGFESLYSNTTGNYNTANGASALVYNTTGYNNTANGGVALFSNTTGYNNTANGIFALYLNTTGSNNTAVGYCALFGNTTGINNIGIGKDAFTLTQTDNNSIVIGAAAIGLGSNTVVLGNTSITTTRLRGNVQGGAFVKDGGTNVQYLMADGSVSTGPVLTGFVPYTGATGAVNLGAFNLTVNSISVGKGSGTGTFNTAIGQSALSSNTIGSSNIAIGDLALSSNTIGNENVAIGYKALTTSSNSYYNTAVGWGSGELNTTGTNNVFLGWRSGRSNTTASNNTFIGYQGGAFNTTGNGNTLVGFYASRLSTTASQNASLGYQSLNANTTGSFNSVVGYNALQYATTASSNVAIGWNAGSTQTGAGGLANNPSNSVYIGYDTKSPLNNQTNQIVIGHSAIGAGSDTVTLGNASITTTRLRGVVQGGSFVKDTGTVYQTLMADGSVTTDGTLYKTSSTTYQSVSGTSYFYSTVIPSNIFASGDNLKINTITATTTTSTAVVIMRYYINTTPSIVGATQIANWSGNAGSISYPMDRVYWVNGSDFYARNFTSSSPSSSNTGTTAINNTPIPGGSFYIIVEVITTAPDLAGLLNFQIIKS